MTILEKNTDSQNLIQTEKIMELQETIISEKDIKYQETPYRWFFLISYSLNAFSNQMQWVSFSAIATDFSINYETALWKVYMFSLIFMIINLILSLPEAWLLDKYSIRLSLILAAGCNIIGSGLKLLLNIDNSLTCCYIGQIFAGLFQPAILNSPGKIAANWFREDIRTVICTVCCLSVTIGTFVGFLWNLIFIKEEAEKDEYKNQVFIYFLSEFILNILFCAPTFFITKEKPDIPPSPSQEEESNIKIPNLKESLKLLFTNFRFICLFISYLLVVGYFDIMSTIINSLLDLYTITTKQSSIIYAVSSISGMLGSLIISRILDKYKKFKLTMIILSISGFIFQALFTFLLELGESKEYNAYAIGLIVYSLISISIVSFYTIGLNYACEITYPVGESINGCIMASSPQIISIGLTFLCDYFINDYKDKKWISNVILLIVIGISIIFVCLLDEKLDRQEIEEAGRLKEKMSLIKDDKKENI